MPISTDKWFTAVAQDDMAAVREMIVMGADMDVRDELGRNAFQVASQYGYTDMMVTILAAKQMLYFKQMEPVQTFTPRKASVAVSSFRKSA